MLSENPRSLNVPTVVLPCYHIAFVENVDTIEAALSFRSRMMHNTQFATAPVIDA